MAREFLGHKIEHIRTKVNALLAIRACMKLAVGQHIPRFEEAVLRDAMGVSGERQPGNLPPTSADVSPE